MFSSGLSDPVDEGHAVFIFSHTPRKWHQRRFLSSFTAITSPFIHLCPSPSHSPSPDGFRLVFPFSVVQPHQHHRLSSPEPSDGSSFSRGEGAHCLSCGISLLESCHVDLQPDRNDIKRNMESRTRGDGVTDSVDDKT